MTTGNHIDVMAIQEMNSRDPQYLHTSSPRSKTSLITHSETTLAGIHACQ